jgi:two-component system nitrogen regulation response regulator GlnG
MPHLRVLVVEDESFVRALIVDALDDAGFEVDHTGDADSAVRFLETDGYDILVTDILMPGKLSGLDLAARSRETHPNIPVIVMSARSDMLPGLREAGVKATPLPKPFDVDDLVRTVRRLVESASP